MSEEKTQEQQQSITNLIDQKRGEYFAQLQKQPMYQTDTYIIRHIARMEVVLEQLSSQKPTKREKQLIEHLIECLALLGAYIDTKNYRKALARQNRQQYNNKQQSGYRGGRKWRK